MGVLLVPNVACVSEARTPTFAAVLPPGAEGGAAHVSGSTRHKVHTWSVLSLLKGRTLAPAPVQGPDNVQRNTPETEENPTALFLLEGPTEVTFGDRKEQVDG